MLTAISNKSSDVPVISTPYTITFTDTKIKKILLCFLSGIAVSISILAFKAGGLMIPLFIALPALAISGGLIWLVSRLVDYADPEVLAQFRADASSDPLNVTIAKHGWDKMLQYEIPSSQAFQDRYTKHMENLSFRDALAFYETAIAMQDKFVKDPSENPFVLPHPSHLSDKFLNAIQNSPFDAGRHYDLNKLHSYGIITFDFIQTQNDYKELISLSEKNCADTKQRYINFVNESLNFFQETVNKIEITTERDLQWIVYVNGMIASIQEMVRTAPDKLELPFIDNPDLGILTSMSAAYRTMKASIEDAARQRDEILTKLNENLRNDINLIYQSMLNSFYKSEDLIYYPSEGSN